MQISRSGLLENLIFVQLASTFLTVYENKFITAVTVVPHWSIPWPGWIKSTHFFFCKIHFHTIIPTIPKSLKWFSFQVSRIRSVISKFKVHHPRFKYAKERRILVSHNTTVYTGCPRSYVPDFGRVFLMLKYTDITQNTYIQSWTVTEIMAREVWNFDSCYSLIDYQIHIKIGRNVWFL